MGELGGGDAPTQLSATQLPTGLIKDISRGGHALLTAATSTALCVRSAHVYPTWASWVERAKQGAIYLSHVTECASRRRGVTGVKGQDVVIRRLVVEQEDGHLPQRGRRRGADAGEGEGKGAENSPTPIMLYF